MKFHGIGRWFEFKREAIIIFANLNRNAKARYNLKEYATALFFLGYLSGLVVSALIRLLLWAILS